MESRKTALVTGGARGLGKATAIRLAKDGFNVAISYNSSEKEAQSLIHILKGYGVLAHAIKGDMTKSQDVNHIAETVLKIFGKVDVLINNAGPFIDERKTFSEYSLDEINYLVNGHFVSVLQLEHLLLPSMKESNWGRIIHYGFDKAHEAKGYPLRAVYAASRVALVSYTKTLAVEEAENNITVNMICIGDIRDPFKEMAYEDVIKHSEENHKNVKPGSGNDIANLVSFLCSDKSTFINGSIIELSGGIDPIYQRAQMLKKSLERRK